MNIHHFDSSDLILIKYLKSETPKRIWWNPIQYIFDYENYFIKLEICCCNKNQIACSNDGNIMSVKFEKINKKYLNLGGSKILCENKNISNVYIVRTLIYFHDYRSESYLENINYNYFGDFQINPKEKLETDVNPESSYLVDVGILINYEENYIDAFVKGNNDDFEKIEENYELKNIEFENLPKEYEYLTVW